MSNNELTTNINSNLILNENLLTINNLIDSLIDFSIQDLKPNDIVSFDKVVNDFSLNGLINKKYSNYNVSQNIPGLLLHKKDSSNFFLFDQKDEKLIKEILSHKIDNLFINIYIKSLTNYSFNIYKERSSYLYLGNGSIKILLDDDNLNLEKLMKYLQTKKETIDISFQSICIFKPQNDFCKQLINENFKINETIIKDILISNIFFNNFVFYKNPLHAFQFQEYVSEKFLEELKIYIEKQFEDLENKRKQEKLLKENKEQKIKEYKEKQELEVKEKKRLEEKRVALVLICFIIIVLIVSLFK